MTALLILVLTVAVAVAATFFGGRRYQRHVQPTVIINPDAPEAGREWAAEVCATVIKGQTSAGDPLRFTQASGPEHAYTLHYKRDLDLFVYLSGDTVIHGKDFAKWATRVVRERAKVLGVSP